MYTTLRIVPGVFAIEEGNTRMFLVVGRTRALLLDTGMSGDGLKKLVNSLTDLPITVALTHGHVDHVGGVTQFGTVLAHRNEWEEIQSNLDGKSIHLEELRDGDTLDLGDHRIEVRETTGHTSGSLSFLDRKNRLLFSGDNVSDRPIFMCLPGADMQKYRASLQWILAHSNEFDLILGCHGQLSQPAEQVERLLACLDACEKGNTQDEPVVVYSGETYLKKTYKGASIYAPLPSEMKGGLKR